MPFSKSTLTAVFLSVVTIAVLNQFDATKNLIGGGRRFFS